MASCREPEGMPGRFRCRSDRSNEPRSRVHDRRSGHSFGPRRRKVRSRRLRHQAAARSILFAQRLDRRGWRVQRRALSLRLPLMSLARRGWDRRSAPKGSRGQCRQIRSPADEGVKRGLAGRFDPVRELAAPGASHQSSEPGVGRLPRGGAAGGPPWPRVCSCGSILRWRARGSAGRAFLKIGPEGWPPRTGCVVA